MSSPFVPSSFSYNDAPQGGALMPMIIAGRDPSDTIDKNYAAGYLWLSSLDVRNSNGTTGSGTLFVQSGNQAGLPNWSPLSPGTGGPLSTLSNGSTLVFPSGSGNIAIDGTLNQITSTSNVPGHAIVLSIPTNFIAPGKITSSGDTDVLGNLIVSGTSTFTGGITFSGNVAVGGTLTVTGLTTLAALTQVGTANINASGAAVTTIATGGTGALHLGNATGNTDLTGSFSTLTDAATFVIGTSAQTGKTTIVSSTAANDIVIQDGVNVAAQTVSISNGATGADSTVSILSGTGTAGVGILLMADNPRVTTIDLGNVAPDASRTTIIGGGTVVTAITDTINIGPNGATTNAGASKVVNINTGGVTLGSVLTNIASGNVTSGTHTTSIATGNRAAGTMALNIMTGTGTKTLNAGNADGLTTFSIKGVINLNASQNSNTNINTGTSTGTVAIGNSLATAATIDAVTISLDATTASNFTVTGATQDLTLSSVGGSVNVQGTEAAADAVKLNASNIAGGITMSAGTGGILPTTSGKFTVISTDNAAQAIELHANGGTSETIRLRADQGTASTSLDLLSDVGGITLNAGLSSASAINITSSAAGGGWTLNSGTAGVTLANTGKLSLAGAAASDITITGAFDLALASTAGRSILQSGKAATDAVKLNATDAAGGITMTAGTGNINITGNVLKLTNPAFLAYLAATQADKTGNGASYTLGTNALTEVYDRGTNFNTNGTFTAPVTGIYDLRSQITLTGCTIATGFVITIVTTARSYIYTFNKAPGSQDETVSVSALADMTATDTAHVNIVVTGEAADTVDILGAADAQTYFCGCLVG